MSLHAKNSTVEKYYSGGLSELVNRPSALTYSFFKDWFMGTESIGSAMKLLGLPYEKTNLPLLIVHNSELFVDLNAEEKTLYKNTIFFYKKQQLENKTPTLGVSVLKCFSPLCLMNTLKIVLVQSQWVSNPKKAVERAQDMVNKIPENTSDSIAGVENLLAKKVWPEVIAVGMMSEFFSQLVVREGKRNRAVIDEYITSNLTLHDWFFKSIADQVKVKQNEMSFLEYTKLYGLRSDKDYELVSPRWYEIESTLKKRIGQSTSHPISRAADLQVSPKLKSLIDASVSLQLLRSEAKKKTLVHIDMLRQLLLKQAKNVKNIDHLSKEDIMQNNYYKKQQTNTDEKKQKTKLVPPISGHGTTVSQGEAIGVVMHVSNNEIDIPKGSIGVFPNASPEFAIQYSKCAGMIFLKGGQTSHGAIVAREYGIPAIVDHTAEALENGGRIELNANSGEWKVK